MFLDSFTFSNFNYCPLVWHLCSPTLSLKKEIIQERALRLLYNDSYSSYDIRTHNDLARKRTLNHLAKLALLLKWLNCVVSTYLHGAFDCILLSCHLEVSEWIYTLWFAWKTRNSLFQAGAISEA